MKTIRLFTLLTLLAVSSSATSQDRGFFRTYPLTTDTATINSPLAVSMAETQDGGFSVAIGVVFGGLDPSWGRLFKLSDDGELLNSVHFGNDGGEGFYTISNIFRHPDNPCWLIGLGQYDTTYQTTPFIQITGKPYYICFDESLGIINEHLCEWPEEYQNIFEAGASFTLLSDRKIFSSLSFRLASDPFPQPTRRFFAELSLDGEFERMVADTITTDGAEALFEFPNSGLVGKLSRGSESHNLYRLNKQLEPSLVNQYHRVYSDTIHNYEPNYWDEYYVNLLEPVSTNILALNDSSLLIPMLADELIQRIHIDLDTTFFYFDNTPVLLKTDTDGNLLQVAIVCRINDTVDAISRPVALAEPDGSGHRCFYLCHYSRDRNYLQSPNNFTVTKYTDDLAIVWRKTFSLHDTHFVPNGIVATHDGGCFIAGTATSEGAYIGINGWFALKIGADGTVGSGEITVKDDVFFYPNPVKDMLHLCTPPDVQPKQVELYDLQGRLVRSQGNTFKSIDMGQLPAGTYTLRVTMQDGQTFSDMVVKE